MKVATFNKFNDLQITEQEIASNSALGASSITSGYFLNAKEAPKTTSSNRYGIAVIIGNGNYEGYGQGVPNVDFAHNDAEAIKQYVLTSLGYRDGNIIFLKDARHADLVSTFGVAGNEKGKIFDWIRKGKSDVFVYYSGHGAPSLDSGRGYLLSVDADPQRVELSGYPLDTLYENLSKLPAKSITVVMDACFSGSSQEGSVVKNASSISLRQVEPKLNLPNATILTAAGLSEVASWDTTAKLGLFTKNFLQGVYGEADKDIFGNNDGTVTLAELKEYLTEEVPYQARRNYGREQNPQIVGNQDLVMSTLAN